MAENTFTVNLRLPVLSGDTNGGMYEFNRAIINITMNAFCITISRLLLSAPPESPARGDIYLVLDKGQDDWENQGNNLAYYYNGWTFLIPRIGFSAYDLGTNKLWTLT